MFLHRMLMLWSRTEYVNRAARYPLIHWTGERADAHVPWLFERSSDSDFTAALLGPPVQNILAWLTEKSPGEEYSMSRIPGIEPDDAPPAVRAIYAKYKADGFPIFNVMKMFANKAEFLAALYELTSGLYINAKLAARYRELAYLRTSQINACHY
jgi:hypothetical protein